MVYRKNDRQIDKEKSEQRYYAKLVKGYPSPVCEYFVVHQTKGNVDVWNLSTEEIVEYILSTKNMDILKYCKQDQMINDYSTLQSILKMEKQHGHIIKDIVGSMNGYKLYNDAYAVVDYKRKIEGQEVSVEDIMANLEEIKKSAPKFDNQTKAIKATQVTKEEAKELDKLKGLIYRKSDEEIQKKKVEQLYYARLVKGIPSPVCEYFVVHKTKGVIDIWDLSTEDIVKFIISNKNNNGFDILKYCNSDQMINDYSTLQSILDMEQQHGHIIRDIVGSMNGFKLYNDAKTAAIYKSQAEGKDVTVQDVISDYVNYENAQSIEQEQSNEEEYTQQTVQIEETQQERQIEAIQQEVEQVEGIDNSENLAPNDKVSKYEKEQEENQQEIEQENKIKSRDPKEDLMEMITCSTLSHMVDLMEQEKSYVEGSEYQIQDISSETKDAIKRSFKLMCSHDDRRIKVNGEFQSASDVARKIFINQDEELLQQLLSNKKISNNAKRMLQDLKITMPLEDSYYIMRRRLDIEVKNRTYWGESLTSQIDKLKLDKEKGREGFYWGRINRIIERWGYGKQLAKGEDLDKPLDENKAILWDLDTCERVKQEINEEEKFKF